jgi:hypothetical protein
MRSNQKLARVIASRTIKTVTIESGSVLVLFDDQSSMKIKTDGAAAVSPGSKVKSAHEAKADFRIEFEDGSSATFLPSRPGLFRRCTRQEQCSRISRVNVPNDPKSRWNGFEGPIYASATRNLVCVSLCVPRMLAEPAPEWVSAPANRGKGP